MEEQTNKNHTDNTAPGEHVLSLYEFEYKFIPSPNKTISTQDLNDKLIDKTLEGALSQIKNKDYGKTLNAKEQIWAVALVYCEKSRKLERVKGFKIQLKA